MLQIIEEDGKVRYLLSSDPDHVSELLNDVRNQYGTFCRQDITKLHIVLRELVENAVTHGNSNDPKKKTYCEITEIDPRHLRVIIADEGNGFQHQSMDLTLPSRVTRGQLRGLPLVNALVDVLEYNEPGNMATAIVARTG